VKFLLPTAQLFVTGGLLLGALNSPAADIPTAKPVVPRARTPDPMEKEMAEDMVKIIDRLRWSERCENFVQDKNLGPWGTHILSSLNRSEYPELYRGTPDFKLICPAYDDLKDQEKDYVWVMALTAMAFYESSCMQTVSAVGPNGTVNGLMQLHLGKESVYSDGCSKGDSQGPKTSLSCTLSMLNDQIRREQRFFSSKSYWDVLRPKAKSDKAKRIAWSMMLFSLCQKAPDEPIPSSLNTN